MLKYISSTQKVEQVRKQKREKGKKFQKHSILRMVKATEYVTKTFTKTLIDLT